MIHLQKSQDGSEVRLAVGDSLELELPENPTTGYRWHLHDDASGVLQVQATALQRAGTRPGAGGVRTWRLQAAREGTVDLALAYRRPWEDQPVDTFRVTVQVDQT